MSHKHSYLPGPGDRRPAVPVATLPPAQRQIRPPPFSQHVREFAGNRHAWLVLGRNLIPVVGIYWFGWSAALAVFNYWFDGLVGLAAITAAMVPRAIRESLAPADRKKSEIGGQTSEVSAAADPLPPLSESPYSRGWIGMNIISGVFTWLVLLVFVGLPYWIVLIPLHDLLLGPELRQAIAESPGLWITFGSLAAGHFYKAFRAGYDTMPDQQLRQRARWDIYLLVLRAVAMFIMASHGLAFILVPLMALVLTYFEVWPERVLGAVFGDPTRLWEYDPEKGRVARQPRRLP